jgi:steroid delta-isomerase-like uncharacterized protein
MSDTSVRELVLRFYEAFNEGDVSAALSAFSDDLEISDPAIGTVRGVVPFRDYLESFNRAVPDRQIITERLDEAADAVFVEGHFVGTHTGPVIGPGGATIQPTGASIRLRFVNVWRADGGVMKSHHSYYDQLDLLTQLGLMKDA